MKDLFGIDNTKKEFAFDSNLELRIRNFDLSPDDYMMPIFEAISNSIHSINEFFGIKKAVTKGNIVVEFIKDKGELKSVRITDNGTGFNDVNFASFLKFDSDYKKQQGGKGIGRFMWLKAFNNVHISSVIKEHDKSYQRNFKFSVSENPVTEHSFAEFDGPRDTIIEFFNVKPDFKKCFDVSLDVMVEDTISHFIPMLVANTVPNISFIMDDVEIHLKDRWAKNLLESKEEILDQINKVIIKHCKIKSKLAKENVLHLCANGRSVQKISIGNKLGLKTGFYDDSTEELYNYVGIVSSDMFDRLVSANRSDFTKNNIVKNIVEQAVEYVKNGYLSSNFSKALLDKSEKIKAILTEFPRFSHLVDNAEEYAEKHINPSSTTKLEILKDLSNAYIEEEERLSDQLDSLKIKAEHGENIEFNETARSATKMTRSALEDYVKKRKDVLDILETMQGYEDANNQKNFLEKAIHSVICPMKKDSNDISIEEHNLWIIDDRLAYCKYFASDKEIKNIVKNSSSELAPDILFAGCTLYRSSDEDQTIRIIEFKRPGRDDYTENNNPINQIFDYIDALQDGKIVTPKGKKITDINDRSIFYCYIVCDLTNTLKRIIERKGIFKPHPDGRGYFGYNDNKKAYIDIIQYDALLKDAKLRNQIFFDKLT